MEIEVARVQHPQREAAVPPVGRANVVGAEVGLEVGNLLAFFAGKADIAKDAPLRFRVFLHVII